MARKGPYEKIISGNIEGSIWENSTLDSEKRKFLSLKIEKRYRTRDGEWKSGNNYTRADIAKLKEILNKADGVMRDYESQATSETATSQNANHSNTQQH